MKRKKKSFFGGCQGRCERGVGQGRCEQRSEAFVNFKKKMRKGVGLGGCRVRRGRSGGWT